MIEETLIKKLAIKWQTTNLNVAREYFQHRFLNFFYQQKASREIFFKGGTALRLVYQSPRFSEDLDFSSKYYSCRPVEDVVQETLLQLEKEGIEMRIEESKKTFGGCLFLFTGKISGFEVSLRLDISLRKKKLEGRNVLVKNPLTFTYSVLVLKAEDLVAEKIQAALTRSKPRDFFDLYYILRSRIGIASIIPKREKLIEKLKKTNVVDFRKELGKLLPKSYSLVLRDLDKIIVEELGRL